MKIQSLQGGFTQKRLCLDARMYQHSGIGVYICQQIRILKESEEYELILLVPDKGIPEFEGIEQVVLDAPVYSLKEQWLYPLRIPSCDVFWSPHFNAPLLPVKARERWVTIHDVYHLRFKSLLSLPQKIYASVLYRAACFLSDRIYTVSAFSKKEILSFFHVEKKIKVVPNTIDVSFFQQAISEETSLFVRNKYHLFYPYILFVGSIKPHKNLITLIRAYEQIMDAIDQVRIVVVGKQEGLINADEEVVRYLSDRPSLKDRVLFTGRVSEEEMPVIYRSAQLFVFPSFYEGFGYPPLEALASGVPVICSNAGPMPEICGDRVTYFDPENMEQLSSLIRTHFSSKRD